MEGSRVSLSLLAIVACWLSLAPAVTAASSSWAWTFDIRRDAIDENYVSGYLTWDGSAGGIAWGKGGTSQESAPWLGDTNRAVTGYAGTEAGWMLRTHTGSDQLGGQPLLPTIEFRSAPLPQTYYLNASRGISVDIYFKSPRCVTAELELWVGDVFAGGQVASTSRQTNGKFVSSPPISGHCGRTFGLHSETGILPRGAIVRLRLTLSYPGNPDFADQPVLIGTKDRSVIHFPILRPEELVFEMPHILGGAPGGSSESGASVEYPALLLLAMPLFLGRRRAGLMAVVLLAGAAAGCVGGGRDAGSAATEAPVGGRVNQTLVPDPGGAGNGSAGGIAGVVHDEFNVPIPGVQATLMGTEHFGATDNFGRFQFHNVTPGDHLLRLTRPGWRVLEEKVTVRAGQISKLDILLEPLVKKSGGANRHRHDYWLPEETSRVIFNGPVTFAGFQNRVPGCTAGQSIGSQYFCVANFYLPATEPNGLRRLVLPGTNDVEVKVSWDPSSNRVQRVGVGFTPNDNTSDFFQYPRPSGVPTHIRTTWPMADYGHQGFSTWALWLYIPTNDEGYFGGGRPTFQPIQQPFNVEVKVHRGVVPLEPGHRDPWGPNTTITVLERKDVTTTSWSPTRSIPPGTKSIEVVYEQKRATNNEWTIVYKAANEPSKPIESYKALAGGTRSGTKVTFHYELAPGEADPFYAKRSFWHFARVQLSPDPVKTQQDSLDDRQNGPNTVSFTVIAHKDPEFRFEDE